MTAKSVDLVIARNGFPSSWKSSVIFIVATLIVEVLFEQFLIGVEVTIEPWPF